MLLPSSDDDICIYKALTTKIVLTNGENSNREICVNSYCFLWPELVFIKVVQYCFNIKINRYRKRKSFSR